ncbi:methionine aminotransferase [Adhaeribacter radiodurans]|uniref:Methionine aminotransferase n=1 Tax=Adhaeribacter radiodurans TaxID=2745197 RepID=A0A7L7LCU0_9BACT|nr:methionine aminotransferase [Adhaeribacter radiodurans]QMU30593.1 methionine aminotransferase [Adhaeribacter radiodurans]
MILTSKLPQVGTSIFTVMSQLAQQYGAINLSQGFPDFNCPPELTELVSDYLRQGFNQYAPMAGVLKLREQISSKTEKLYGFAPDPDTEITITSGATEALYAALAAILRPGDEVIILEPAYDSYVPAILLNGGQPVFVPLQVPSFAINWQLVKEAITSRTRAILLNSPHNPSGAVLSASDLLNLAELVTDTNILIISDEVYEHMVFDGQPHLSLLTKPELAARSFVISSFGKTYHATGWKVAYCVAPAALTIEFRKVHQYLTFSTVTPIQYAIADYLDNQEHYLTLPAFYQAKRDLFHQLLQSSRFTLTPSAGTYFQLVSYENITQERDQAFARRLTTEVGVAAIPISVFYHQQTDHGLLRFCFAKNEDTLRAAAEKLNRL